MSDAERSRCRRFGEPPDKQSLFRSMAENFTGVYLTMLVANHAIVSSPTAWLATLAIMFFAWTLGTFYIGRQQEVVVREPFLKQLLRDRTRPLLLQTLGGGTLLGALAIVCRITDPNAGAAETDRSPCSP